MPSQVQVLLRFTAPLFMCLATVAGGQTPALGGESSPSRYETRAELQLLAASAQRDGNVVMLTLLRARLENGDFQTGDRIVIDVRGAARPDTIQLRAGKVLPLAGMDDLPLDGVLRSELTDVVHTHLARYLREPEVRVTSLVPVAILGSVAAPGYYYASPGTALRDVFVLAGGLRDGDLERVTVRRRGETIWNAPAVRDALASGWSLDGLHLRAGDEILVPQVRHIQMTTVVAMTTSIIALTLALLQFQHAR